MPSFPGLYLTEDEYDEVRKICKTLNCSTYAFQKGCVQVGLKNYDQLKEAIKKIKPKNRGVKIAERRGGKENGLKWA